MNGVQQNKEHWLELAQNVHNRSSLCNAGTTNTLTEITTTSTPPTTTTTTTATSIETTTTTTPASKITDGDSITLVSQRKNDSDNNNLNNNNVIVNNNRCVSQSHEENNIIICNGTNNSEIPKIVGKIGRLSSQNIFAPKLQNGINCGENLSNRDLTHQDAMDK